MSGAAGVPLDGLCEAKSDASAIGTEVRPRLPRREFRAARKKARRQKGRRAAAEQRRHREDGIAHFLLAFLCVSNDEKMTCLTLQSSMRLPLRPMRSDANCAFLWMIIGISGSHALCLYPVERKTAGNGRLLSALF